MTDSVRYWLDEIAAAKKREKDWRKDAQRVLDIYSGEKDTPFNILYSNTETLLPALYSAVPRPVVQRRFKDADPAGKSAAQAGQRVLEYLVDTNVEGYETFDEGLRAATLDALLQGRGVTCVKYDAEVGEDAKDSELVCLDSKAWNRVYFGFARKWSNVPWVAYEEYIDRREADRLFGDKAGLLTFTETEDDEDKDKAEESDERKTACIYQIWDKSTRQVRYVSPQVKDAFLKVDDDPLELTGFFNCPRPLQFLEKNDLRPSTLYAQYENQAKELNRLTIRINKIVEAIKARGAYDSELGEDIGNIMSAEENALVPADKSSSLAAEKGLANAIWFMPIEQLTSVLAQLYQAREQCKQVIYEITGIADIMRGSSQASETLGAQEIKQHWGTLRLKRLQKEVQRYARDLLRMTLDVAARRFSEPTFAAMTGLPFLPSAHKAQAQQLAQQAQRMGQELPPQIQQALAQPSWADVLPLLRTDTHRAYRIDIESNSTVEPEATEDQQHIAEVMNALAQYLNGVAPLVVSGALPFEAAQAMLLAITRRFRFGTEIEDTIHAMKAPKPPDEGKDEGKQEIEALKLEDARETREFERERLQLEREKLTDERTTAAADREHNEAERAQRAAKLEFDALQMEYEAMQNGPLSEMLARLDQQQADANARFEALLQAQQQQSQAFMAGMQALAEQITRPKRLVRDQQGRPAGVETV